MRPEPSPDGTGLLVAADLVRSDLPAVRAVQVGGGTHGRLDLPVEARREASGDLRLVGDGPGVLVAGTLPDGRPLRFEVRALRPAGRAE